MRMPFLEIIVVMKIMSFDTKKKFQQFPLNRIWTTNKTFESTGWVN